MEFQIPSVDPKKHYTFYVKSKLHDNCATTDLWSEESNPIFWGKGEQAGQDGFSVSQSQEGNKNNVQPMGTSPAFGDSCWEAALCSKGTSQPPAGVQCRPGATQFSTTLASSEQSKKL